MNPEATTAAAASAVYTAGTNPWPFVIAAYIGGLLIIGGYTWWASREKKRVQKMLDTLLNGKTGQSQK